MAHSICPLHCTQNIKSLLEPDVRGSINSKRCNHYTWFGGNATNSRRPSHSDVIVTSGAEKIPLIPEDRVMAM